MATREQKYSKILVDIALKHAKHAFRDLDYTYADDQAGRMTLQMKIITFYLLLKEAGWTETGFGARRRR